MKTLLSSVGELPPGYKDIRPGFDFMVLEGLKLDPDRVRDFILENRPTYLQFEDWIRTRDEADLSPENIARVNTIVVERKKAGESRKRMLEENGLSEECDITDSIMMNNLDDWREIHGAVVE